MRSAATSRRQTGAMHRFGRSTRRACRTLSFVLAVLVGALTPGFSGFGSVPSAEAAASRPASPAAQFAAPRAPQVPRTVQEGQIIRLYRAVLDRSPDGGGFAFWVRRLHAGTTIDDVAAGFVSSREFRLVYGEPDDGEFIELLYRNVLNREPDAAGRAFWVDQLGSGLDRVRIVVLFSESSEFIELSGTALPSLPPFDATISLVTAEELGSSWRAGCPVGPDQLRRLEVSTVNFDGNSALGTLILHEDVAEDVARVFEELYRHRYPVERMETIEQFGSDDLVSMDANNTSNFNCRPVTGGTGWSRHAFGRAVDINPVQNPYVTSTQLLPPEGAAFVDRSGYHPAMIYPDDVVVNAFAAIGWRWGGNFNSIKDWHHFDTE